jgi:subtilisin family serine protease
MGRFMNRGLGLFVASLLVFSASTGFAASKYVVVFKSQQNMRAAKSLSERSGTFLGTRAVTQKYLENLDMVIVEADAEQARQITHDGNVAFVEKEFVVPAPKFPLYKQSDRANYIPPKNADLTWGIQAIKADKAWAVTKGGNARIVDLDTGIDMNHGDLKNRIEKTQVFTGTAMKDDVGHGTHTAGTMVADGSESGLLGVAPEAHLLVGKVCANTGCNSTAILSGVDWAITEHADVVNMSLGGPFSSSTAAAAYKKAEAAGVMVVAASGNSGIASVGYPAAYESVLAVGALMPDLTKAEFSQWGPSLDVMAPGVNVYSTVPQGTGREGIIKVDGNVIPSELFVNSNPPAGTITGNIMFAGLGKPTDVQGKDFTGSIALIQRGEIAFADKVKAAMGAGAKGVVIYDNVPGLLAGGLQNAVTIPVLFIDQAAGEAIVASLNQGISVSAEVGTTPTDYMIMHGTSMACPHATGVAALIRSVNKNLTPAQVRDVMKNTATPLVPNDQNQMGAGLINAEKAVSAAQAMILPPL